MWTRANPRFWPAGGGPQNMDISNVKFIFKFQEVIKFDYLLRDLNLSSWHPHNYIDNVVNIQSFGNMDKARGDFPSMSRGGGWAPKPPTPCMWTLSPLLFKTTGSINISHRIHVQPSHVYSTYAFYKLPMHCIPRWFQGFNKVLPIQNIQNRWLWLLKYSNVLWRNIISMLPPDYVVVSWIDLVLQVIMKQKSQKIVRLWKILSPFEDEHLE